MTDNMPESVSRSSERRRRRLAISCVTCRQRKVRCNRELPCSACIRSKKTAHCVYESEPVLPAQSAGVSSTHRPRTLAPYLGPTAWPPSGNKSTATIPPESSSLLSSPRSGPLNSSTADLSTNNSSGVTLEQMRRRIKELEQQLVEKNSDISSSISSTGKAGVGSTQQQTLIWDTHDCEENYLTTDIHTSNQITYMKTRMFGGSHFTNIVGLIAPFMHGIGRCFSREHAMEPAAMLAKCKSLSRAIKEGQNPEYLSPAPQLSDLPTKELMGTLIETYLRTSESIYRVLLVPGFQKDFEAFCNSTDKADPMFVRQLKLVLAIGSVAHDEHFSLRTSAIQWINEGLAWLRSTNLKSQLNIASLQVMILLLLARQAVGVGGDLNWIAAGALLRTAICMGLHRDPSILPRRSHLVSELRKRLWNTVLELCLLYSFDAGGPPMISLSDFDTKPPENLDDSTLSQESQSQCLPHQGGFTDMSVAIALRQTFPVRLAVVQFMNGIRSGLSYADTLKHDAQLRDTFKGLAKSLRGSPSSGRQPSSFTLRYLDLFTSRYFIALHIHFMGLGVHDTTYMYSRHAAVEASLKVWQAVEAPVSQPKPSSEEKDEFELLLMCGRGYHRTILAQATMISVTELHTQIQARDDFGPITVRSDLPPIPHLFEKWATRRVQAGETNVKGVIMARVLQAKTAALYTKASEEETSKAIVAASAAAERDMLPILERMATRYRVEEPKGDMAFPATDSSDWMAAIRGDYNFDLNKVPPYLFDDASWIMDSPCPGFFMY